MSETRPSVTVASRRKPLAIVLSVAITALGLTVAPLAVSSASAASASSLTSAVLKDLNAWRASQGAAPIKLNSRMSAAVQAEGDAQLAIVAGDTDAYTKFFTALASFPSGGTDEFEGGGFSDSGSSSAIALEMAQGIESSAVSDGSDFLSDNYAGLATIKVNGQWESDIVAENFTSPFLKQSTKPKVTITGKAEVGATLTAHSSIKASSSTVVSYEWFIGGYPASSSGDTFTIPTGEPDPFDETETAVGQKVTVLESVQQTGKDPNVGSASSARVTLAHVTSAAVSVTGDRYVGDTLTATTGTWAPSNVELSYQWYRDSYPIADATSSTYPQVAADVNHLITVRVTGDDYEDGYLPAAVKTTTKVKTAGPLLTNTTAPQITGDDVVGATLTTTNGDWTDGTSTTAQTFTYQWSVGGKPVSGATKQSFVVPTSAYTAAGLKVTVAVTAHEVGYSNTTVTSDPTDTIAGLEFTVTGTPTYSGTLAVGKTIKAVLPTYSPKPTTIKYSWQIDGVVKSTSSIYKIPSSAVGKTITLVITASKSGYVTSTTGDDDIEVPGSIE